MLLSHDDEGTGPAVLLLHSGVCDRRMWEPQVVELRDGYRVLRPDLRGFGSSPLPAERFAFADDVVAVLDHLGVERTALVGSSLGGRVALEIAATRPDRVESLVLLCPAYAGLEPTAAAEAFNAREDELLAAGRLDEAVALNVSTWLGPEASDEWRRRVGDMQRHAFDVQLAAESGDEVPELIPVEFDPTAVTAPTVVVSGDLDMDHFQNIARQLCSVITDCQLMTLPWAAHLPSLERPREITTLIAQVIGADSAGG